MDNLFKKGNPFRVAYVPSSASMKSVPKDDTKATVILVTEVDWGDGSVYNFVADATHSTYGQEIPESGPMTQSGNADYSVFNVLIPENADGVLDGGAGLSRGESDTVYIEPGLYDYAITNPTPNDRVWIATGDDARGNDFMFAAGVVYKFTVSKRDFSDIVTLDIYADKDLALDSLIFPKSSVDLTAEESISIKVTNRGKTEVPSFTAQYKFNEDEWVKETVAEKLAPGESYTYTFAAKVNMEKPSCYKVIASIEWEDDMNPYNNTIESGVWHYGSFEPPFFCDFENESDWPLWTVIDNNEDGTTWIRKEEKNPEATEGYSASCSFNSELDMDDYLVSRNPVKLKKGVNHIYFRYNAMSQSYTERLSLLYGTDDQVENMTELGRYEFAGAKDWYYGIEHFTLETDAEIYFAFHGISDADQYGILLDDIKVDTGVMKGTPDLVVERLILPEAGCDLSTEETVGVVVNNIGSGMISSFELKLFVDDIVYDKTFHDTIPILGSKTVYMDPEIDFSQAGHTYSVVLEATVLLRPDQYEEYNFENNRDSGYVRNFELAQLPFITDFTDPVSRVDWEGRNWSYDSVIENAMLALGTDPIVSRCVELDVTSQYRFSMNFKAGMLYWIFTYVDNVDILYGISGTPVAGWDTLKSFKDLYTEELYIDFDTVFTVENSGHYSFAVVASTGNRTLCLKEIVISEMIDHDASILSFAVPTFVPAEHLRQSTVSEVSAKNSGKLEIETLNIEIKEDEKVLGSAEWKKIASNTTVHGTINIKKEDCQPEQEVALVAKVSIAGFEDQDLMEDNDLSASLTVSDTVLAYDRIGAEELDSEGVGNIGNITVAYPFFVGVEDTLTSIQVAWSRNAYDQEIKIGIYPFDKDSMKIGIPIYLTSTRLGSELGWVEYPVPSLLLKAGCYLFSVDFSGYSMIFDKNPNGCVYVFSEDGEVGVQTGFGTPGIRAVFGHEGNPKAVDVMAEQILKPESEGIFSENEPVVVKVTNLGYEKVNTTVHLMVNKTLLEPQVIELDAYSFAEVTFEADLSLYETEYILTAFTVTEGDEVVSNDTCYKIVTTLQEGDPYVMNFESCKDFLTSGFIPAWTTVDMDGSPTYEIDFTFPGACEPSAFIVINPSMTDPSIETDLPAHSGSKYGAAVSSISTHNDDWLISPKLKLPAENAHITFFARGATDEYGNEKYNVLISEIDNDPENFTILKSGEVGTEWEEITVSLDEYAGREVWLAIQCVSEDAYLFMVDDIEVSKPEGLSNETWPLDLSAYVKMYPNPVKEQLTFSTVGLRINQVAIYNVWGEEVYASASNLKTENYRYNVSGLASGIYFARINTEKGLVVMKFVVR